MAERLLLNVAFQYIHPAAKNIRLKRGCKAAPPDAIAFTYPPKASCHFEKMT
ncbi:MAG: hypothetical protein R2779_08085 [Crocinitomicaceae bacterium]